MIEFHSHLLPNIDDGSKSFEESLNTIKKMIDLGYKKIVITPHYINGTSFNANNSKKWQLFTDLKEKVKESNLDIELFLGNEIFIDENILSLIKQNEICTINDTKYIFIELARHDVVNNLEEIIFKLISKGIIPIIAHPERYIFIKKDYEKINKLITLGVLFQVNFESINGKYGRESKKLVKYIFKNNLAKFIGGDIHHEDSDFFIKYDKTKRKIIKLIGINKFEELTIINPNKVLNNEII